MDQVKIGKFIAEMRKEQGMTQKQLADKLEISDKTISKWECGNGLPEMDSMMPLCEVLEINVNELLSGEKLLMENYPRKAEENMMNLIQETEEQRKNKGTGAAVFFSVVMIIAAVALLKISAVGVQESVIQYFLDIPSIVVLALIMCGFLAASGSFRSFFGAFRIAFARDADVPLADMKKAELAVVFAGKVLLYAGIFMSLFYAILLLHKMTDYSCWGVYFALACISTFYAVFLNLFLLLVRIRIDVKLSEAENR